LSAEAKENVSEDKFGVFDKLNKSGEAPMDEFKLGVGFVDGTVSKIDSGIKSIQKKIHGSSDTE
jgi:hypothetical protein